MDKFLLPQLKAYAQASLEGDASGHDWHHTLRVVLQAKHIAQGEDTTDPLVIEAAALLHDVMDHKLGYTDVDRATMITNQCKLVNLDNKQIDHVIYIVNNMSFKGGTNTHTLKSLEGQVVQDADRLDALGAIGIARTFAFGGSKNRAMYEPESSDGQDTISHFYQKLLLLKDKMNTPTGKSLAQVRHDFLQGFLDQFLMEWQGK